MATNVLTGIETNEYMNMWGKNSIRMILPVVFVLIFSLLNFQGVVYYAVIAHVRPAAAYLLDQSVLPVVCAIFTLYLFVRSGQLRTALVRFIKKNTLLLAILCILGFAAHSKTLSYFFLAEDSTFILTPIKNSTVGQRQTFFEFHPLLTGYPFAPFVALNLLFGTNVIAYNITGLILYLLTGLVLYGFLLTLTGKKSISFWVSALYLTTTSYIDNMSWHGTFIGTSYIYILSLLGLLFFTYQKDKQPKLYYIISLLFIAAAIKAGFVRMAGYALLPFFIYLYANWGARKSFLLVTVRAFARSLPFILLAGGFYMLQFSTPATFIADILTGKSIGYNTIMSLSQYVHTCIYYIAHMVFPGPAIKQILTLATIISIKYFQGLVPAGSFVLFLTYIALAVLTALCIVILRLSKNKTYLLIVLFAVAVIVVNLAYIPLFGTVELDITKFDVNFIKTIPPYGPGKRYVQLAYMGYGLILAVLTYAYSHYFRSFKNRFRNFLIVVPYAVLGSIVVIQIVFSNAFHETVVQQVSIPDRTITTYVLRMVPRNGLKKLLYVPSIERNSIEVQPGGYEWLYGFYSKDELYYTKTYDEAVRIIHDYAITKDNVYGFYSNQKTLTCADITADVRSLLFDKPKQFIPENLGQVSTTLPPPKFVYNIINSPVPPYRWMALTGVNTRLILPATVVIYFSYKEMTPNCRKLHTLPDQSVTVLWACAEDADWQQQLRSPILHISGIWHTNRYNTTNTVNASLRSGIQCHGGVLRDIYILSEGCYVPYAARIIRIE